MLPGSNGTTQSPGWIRAMTTAKRMCAIAYIGQRLFYVVYVDRADVRRVISLRKANLKEVKRYADA
jgi:uncharacterized DUF497 family protein